MNRKSENLKQSNILKNDLASNITKWPVHFLDNKFSISDEDLI